MHLGKQQALQLLQQLDRHVSASAKVEVVLCPSFTLLETLKPKLEPLKFKLGAQNLHYQDEGAFTGEISGSQLKDLAEYVIIGHSERRLQFSETDDIIARKVAAAVRNTITPILCVGENLFERQDNETARVIHDQLSSGLVMLTAKDVENIVIAYEPVWAVDSDNVATPEQTKKAVQVIRNTIKELFGRQAEDKLRILYGGHMEPEFTQSYLNMKEVDGFLLGRASLNYHDFADIIKLSQSTLRPRRLTKAK